MTVVTLNPSGPGTTSPGISNVGGAASVWAALADASDSTYAHYSATVGYKEVSAALDDITVPAGAVIKTITAVFRIAVASGSAPMEFVALDNVAVRASSASVVSSLTPVDISVAYNAVSLDDLTDAGIDAATVRASRTSGGTVVLLYKARLNVTYVEQPVTNVTAPTDPQSATNVPLVEWENTLDSDGGPQTHYEVKVFTDAQYGAGGFDPATSTPHDTSGDVASSATTWTPDALDNDIYRAYVRVGQTVATETHWSAWDYIQFEVDANRPDPPALDVFAENADARIRIELTADTTPLTPDGYEVQRSVDAGVTWETIRTTNSGLLTDSSGDGLITAYDYESGNGQDAIYRARARVLSVDDESLWSAWTASEGPVSWSHSYWWLKSVTHPELNMTVRVDSQPELERPARQGVHEVLGRSTPIITRDKYLSPRGTLRLRVDDAAEETSLVALLDLLEPLLLQAPPGDNWSDRFVSLGSHNSARGVDKSFVGWTFDTLPWIEVAEPTSDIVEWPDNAGS